MRWAAFWLPTCQGLNICHQLHEKWSSNEPRHRCSMQSGKKVKRALTNPAIDNLRLIEKGESSGHLQVKSLLRFQWHVEEADNISSQKLWGWKSKQREERQSLRSHRQVVGRRDSIVNQRLQGSPEILLRVIFASSIHCNISGGGHEVPSKRQSQARMKG